MANASRRPRPSNWRLRLALRRLATGYMSRRRRPVRRVRHMPSPGWSSPAGPRRSPTTTPARLPRVLLAATLSAHGPAAFDEHVPAVLGGVLLPGVLAAGPGGGQLAGRLPGWWPAAPRRLASAAMASSSRALTRACWSAARRGPNPAVARRWSGWGAGWRTLGATAGGLEE